MNTVKIDSKQNPKIKYVSRLIKDSAFRKSEGKLVVENEVMLKEAISCGMAFDSIFICETALKKKPSLREEYSDFCSNIFVVADEVMSRISDLETPQGVTAVMFGENLPKCEIKENGRYILLERVGDPGNVGTVIRTADAFGIDGVILTDGSADPYSPKVMRSTMGGIFRVPLLKCSLSNALERLKECNVSILAAILDREAKELKSLGKLNSFAVMIGNEAKGLTDEAVLLADEKVFIGMTGKAESLNAAVAASIFMYTLS